MRPLAVLAAVLVAGVALGALAPGPQQADAFERKLNAIVARGAAPPSGRQTEFSGDEVNAYLQLRLVSKFPDGVADPAVTLVGQGRVHARAVVDLDGIRRKSSGSWLDLAAYLSGRLPVTASGTLKTGQGSGQLLLESVEISGIPVPTSLLQELVTYYTRSAEQPNGVSLAQPFELPSNIQRIDVAPDRATVVQ